MSPAKRVFLWLLVSLTLAGGPALAQSSGALQAIARSGIVVVGYATDAPPFSARQEGSNPVGYSLDVCHAIVGDLREATKRPALKVRYVAVGQDQMHRVVASRGVDLLCAAVSDTPERRKSMGFSLPIFISLTKFMVRADSGLTAVNQLAGKRVAVISRTSNEAMLKAHSDSAGWGMNLSSALNADAALGQLQLKQVDAWARDEALLLGIRASQGRPDDFIVLPEGLAPQPLAIAFAKDAELQSVVDTALAKRIRSGEADLWVDKWFVKPNVLFPSGLGIAPSPELLGAWKPFR